MILLKLIEEINLSLCIYLIIYIYENLQIGDIISEVTEPRGPGTLSLVNMNIIFNYITNKFLKLV